VLLQHHQAEPNPTTVIANADHPQLVDLAIACRFQWARRVAAAPLSPVAMSLVGPIRVAMALVAASGAEPGPPWEL
jgi:hypothetical protein